MKCHARGPIGVLALSLLGACSGRGDPAQPRRPYSLKGPLIPAHVTMVAAWDIPKNPLTDATLDQSNVSKEIRRGYRLFMNTPAEAPRFVQGQVSCTNCHLNAGQRKRALPLVAIAASFPEYNRRAGRLITLADRIVDCFLRSENATGKLDPGPDGQPPRASAGVLPAPDSPEVLALSAYLTWLSHGYGMGEAPVWRGQNAIEPTAIKPLGTLDPRKGEALFNERCTNCHGRDGQGVFIADKRAGPLWGPESWNDGAGASRVYTLAGIIRYTMPYLNPGSRTVEEALEVAACITSKPRPSYPFKDQDYRRETVPPDAVYYPKRTPAR
jgi:thiosulfate dehydrogenase